MKKTRLSARVSNATRDRVKRYVRRTGVEEGHLVEQALLHHLQALEELPLEYVVGPRLVVSGEDLVEMLVPARETDPTAALRELMRARD